MKDMKAGLLIALGLVLVDGLVTMAWMKGDPQPASSVGEAPPAVVRFAGLPPTVDSPSLEGGGRAPAEGAVGRAPVHEGP